MPDLFKVGGVAKSKNGYRVRFANDMIRIKILAKSHTDINLVELPTAVSKGDLVTFLKSTELYQKAEYREAIDNSDVKYNGSVSGTTGFKNTMVE